MKGVCKRRVVHLEQRKGGGLFNSCCSFLLRLFFSLVLLLLLLFFFLFICSTNIFIFIIHYQRAFFRYPKFGLSWEICILSLLPLYYCKIFLLFLLLFFFSSYFFFDIILLTWCVSVLSNTHVECCILCICLSIQSRWIRDASSHTTTWNAKPCHLTVIHDLRKEVLKIKMMGNVVY